MPVIEVWCLPRQTQDQLRALHKAIVNAVVSIEVLGLKDETQMTTLFPPDAMRYGLGTDIIVKVYGLDKKTERTLNVRRQLSENLGRAVSSFFPKAKIECFVDEFDHDTSAFWATDGFQNPTGNWSYDGPFEVHLVGDFELDNLNDIAGVTVNGKVVKVGLDPNYPGRITQGIGNVQCYAGDQPFYWGYKFVEKYTRPDGSLIWQNYSYR